MALCSKPAVCPKLLDKQQKAPERLAVFRLQGLSVFDSYSSHIYNFTIDSLTWRTFYCAIALNKQQKAPERLAVFRLQGLSVFDSYSSHIHNRATTLG